MGIVSVVTQLSYSRVTDILQVDTIVMLSGVVPKPHHKMIHTPSLLEIWLQRNISQPRKIAAVDNRSRPIAK